MATQIHPFKSFLHHDAATLHSFLKTIHCGCAFKYLRFVCRIVFEVFCIVLCLAAEVFPQWAAHRAGEEGWVGCTLPEREVPFLMYRYVDTKSHSLIKLVSASQACVINHNSAGLQSLLFCFYSTYILFGSVSALINLISSNSRQPFSASKLC